jgi:hypothetical protein
MEYAGIVAAVLLVISLFSRYRNDSGELRVHERMPLLFPAVGFIITIMIIASAGITPMAQYQGVNSSQFYAVSGDTRTFTIRNSGGVYTESLELSGRYYLQFNDSVHIDIFVSQDSTYVDTLSLDVLYSAMQTNVEGSESIPLAPGSYTLQVNFTRYEGGILQEDPEVAIQMTISQPLIDGFNMELVDWGTYQFVTNIFCIVFILGGFCIGSSTKEGPRVRTEKKEPEYQPSSEYEY